MDALSAVQIQQMQMQHMPQMQMMQMSGTGGMIMGSTQGGKGKKEQFVSGVGMPMGGMGTGGVGAGCMGMGGMPMGMGSMGMGGVGVPVGSWGMQALAKLWSVCVSTRTARVRMAGAPTALWSTMRQGSEQVQLRLQRKTFRLRMRMVMTRKSLLQATHTMRLRRRRQMRPMLQR